MHTVDTIIQETLHEAISTNLGDWVRQELLPLEGMWFITRNLSMLTHQSIEQSQSYIHKSKLKKSIERHILS